MSTLAMQGPAPWLDSGVPGSGAWIEAWASWVLPLAWQGLVLTALALALDRMLYRRLWPQVLQALWLLVLAKHLVPPGWYVGASIAAHFPRLAQLPALTEVAGPASPAPVRGVGPALSPAFPVDAWLWILPAGSLAALLFAEFRARRMRSRALGASTPPPAELASSFESARRRLGLHRRPEFLGPRLVLTSAVPGPAVMGVLRPLVTFPRDLLPRLTAEERDHVLLHELAHVRRGDLVWQRLFQWVHCLFWFQPLLGWARRRARAARELGCDATVATVLGPAAPRYQRTLLRAAGLLLPVSQDRTGLMGRRSSSLTRLDWLDRGSYRGRRRRRLAAVAAFAAAALLLLPVASEPAAEAEARRNLEAAVASGSSLRIRYAFERWRAVTTPDRSADPASTD